MAAKEGRLASNEEDKMTEKEARVADRQKKRSDKKQRKRQRRLSLGTRLKQENVVKVKESFEAGRRLLKGVDRFLETLQFPFQDTGELSPTFKQTARDKVRETTVLSSLITKSRYGR